MERFSGPLFKILGFLHVFQQCFDMLGSGSYEAFAPMAASCAEMLSGFVRPLVVTVGMLHCYVFSSHAKASLTES